VTDRTRTGRALGAAFSALLHGGTLFARSLAVSARAGILTHAHNAPRHVDMVGATLRG